MIDNDIAQDERDLGQWDLDNEEFNRPDRMGPEPFDAFEVQTVGEYSDHEGGTYMEPMTPDQADDDERLGVIWTVYGHRRNQGVWAISDHPDRQSALDMAHALAAGRIEVVDMSFDLEVTA